MLPPIAIADSPAASTPARGADVPVAGDEIVGLLDGTAVSIGPVRSDDERALRRFLHDLCPEARRLRFFSGAIDVLEAARWATDPITGGRHGLVARNASGTIVGHAVYMRLDATSPRRGP